MKTFEKLDKSEMKMIVGGFGGTCGVYLPNGATQDIGGPDGIDYSSATGSSSGLVVRGLSKEDALSLVSEGGRWCCDSCSTASWY